MQINSKKISTEHEGPMKDDNGKLVTNDRERAGVLNIFFSPVYTNGKERFDSWYSNVKTSVLNVSL